ncbi:TauD/TfdA family dioxygenase [Nonomuraea sp. NPDC049709]|uniref:TauD/TfdA family dioxygenase n=1 Tax=Nonomuraea sp. NPDC049709 TaxID=3154736 RepID=UPI003412D78C
MMVARVQGPGEWLADEFRGGDSWKVRLDEGQRREVLAAVRAAGAAESVAAGAGATGSEAAGSGAGSGEGLALPTLGPVLRRVRAELVGGRGFALVQGVPVEEMSAREREVAAVGLAAHVGEVVPQGADRAPFMHVRDTGADPAGARTRSFEHSGRLGFHSDPSDVVALLCVRPAKAGGSSVIVSSVAVHNEIVRLRPDLAEVLYRPWWHDRRTGDGPDSFYTKPICVRRADGGVSMSYGPDYLRSAQRGADVPAFTGEQAEVMDLLDRLTNDARFALAMDFREGDMQFLNNHVVLHGRTAYEDYQEPARRRHLFRLWLATGVAESGIS